MGGTNLEIFKVGIRFLIFPDIPIALLTTNLLVWDVYNVSHWLDVLLRHKPRVPLLRTGLLAQTGKYSQDTVREGRAEGRVGEAEANEAAEESEKIGGRGAERFGWGRQWMIS